MLECPEDAWDKIFEINVKVSFLLFKECVPHMKVDKYNAYFSARQFQRFYDCRKEVEDQRYLSAQLAASSPYPPWVRIL